MPSEEDSETAYVNGMLATVTLQKNITRDFPKSSTQPQEITVLMALKDHVDILVTVELLESSEMTVCRGPMEIKGKRLQTLIDR